MDRATLHTTIQAGRDRFEAILATLPDDAMDDRVDETWTRKDVLAHLEAWERRVVTLLERLRSGAEVEDAPETNELNARYRARDRNRSLADVRAGEREAYEAVLAALGEVSDEELLDGRHFPWTQGDPLADWFRGNTVEHYDEHVEQLTRAARRRGRGRSDVGAQSAT